MAVTKDAKQEIQEKFNFWVPIDFSKAKADEDGNMIVEGIASDNTEDADGEFLDPVGFDFTPLLETGVINWNHQAKKDPDAIIGEPMEARITKDKEFYIKGKLYKDDPKAQATYKKAQIMEKNSSTRRLGWSIEGIPLENDLLNKKRIKRALITGVAITHCPKNANTYVSIVKGMYSEPFVKSDLDIKELVAEYKKWDGSDGKSSFTKNRAHIKEFLENYHEDNLDQLDDLEEAIKSMDTEAVAPLTKESVETDSRKILKKSQVYIEILRNFNVDFEKANKIYELTQTVSSLYFPEMKTNNNHTPVTDEVIQKSFAILREQQTILEKSKDGEEVDKGKKDELDKVKKEGMEKGKETEEELKKVKDAKEKEDMEKGKKEKEGGGFKANKTAEEIEKEIERKDTLKKSAENHFKEFKEKGKDSYCEDMIRKGMSLSECQGAYDAAIKAANEAPNGGEVSGAVLKDVTTGLSEHGGAKHIEKAFDDGFGRMEHLIKSQADFFGQKFSAMADIIEGQHEKIEVLEKSLNTTLQANNELVGKLNNLPVNRKSITTQKQVERFEKSKDGEALAADNKDTFDLSSGQSRQALMRKVESMPEYRGSRALQNAVSQIEIAKSLDAQALNCLQEVGINVKAPKRKRLVEIEEE